MPECKVGDIGGVLTPEGCVICGSVDEVLECPECGEIVCSAHYVRAADACTDCCQ